MITIRVWGGNDRSREPLAACLTEAFAREGRSVRTLRPPEDAAPDVARCVALEVDGVRLPGGRGIADTIDIVLDAALVGVGASMARAPGSLVIENAPATAARQRDSLPGQGHITTCDAWSLASCFEAASGSAHVADAAVAAAMAGAFAASTGTVRLRSVIEAVAAMRAAAPPDLGDAVLAGFTTVVESPAAAASGR